MMNLESIGAMFGLQDKTAVVTGAATGSGRETALLYARAGARIAALDINAGELTGLVAEIAAGGGTAIAVPMDQGDPTSIVAAFASVDATFPNIDVLPNCAGLYPPAKFETAATGLRDRRLDLNKPGCFICSQEGAHRPEWAAWGRIGH